MSAGASDPLLKVDKDLSRLAPKFRDAVARALDECNKAELNAVVYEAYRSQALQAIYYRRGRTVIPPDIPVTNAPTNLHSWHGFGLAVDIVHSTELWSPQEKNWFEKVAAIFQKNNCNWGGNWHHPDPPHFQWAPCPPSPPDKIRELFAEKGITAVWNYFDAVDNTDASGKPNQPEIEQAIAGSEDRLLGIIRGENFSCVIRQDRAGRVYFTADADIDADGANGQNGGPPAYRADDSGTELLKNGGMQIVGNRVVCAQSWARDIVILDIDNEPKIFPNGVIASTTWYRDPIKPTDDPTAYVDAETVPYVVVPPLIVQRTAGIVRGCKARVTLNGISVDCVVADLGPANRVGEISIAAARQLGINPDPRNGGTQIAEVLYELWPGQAADGYILQRA